MPIPFVDLTLQNREVDEEVRQGIDEVIASSAFILGPQVVQFERDFAAFCEARHCVGVANGTDALELMCRAAGIGPGHEVIVPVSTFVATALAVARTGATPARDSLSCSAPAVSASPIGTVTWLMMSPASIFAFMYITVTPVSVSPLAMAHWMGPAPR